jgi:hypothetical protein
MKMNYDETLEEIRRVMANPGEASVVTETFEVMM